MSAMLMRQAADAATAACRRITRTASCSHAQQGTLVAASPCEVGVYIATLIWNGVSTRRLVARTTSGSVDCLPHEFDNKTMLLAWVFRPARSRFVK
jgi:hypothetical protein